MEEGNKIESQSDRREDKKERDKIIGHTHPNLLNIIILPERSEGGKDSYNFEGRKEESNVDTRNEGKIQKNYNFETCSKRTLISPSIIPQG